jgi:hypothetical protein
MFLLAAKIEARAGISRAHFSNYTLARLFCHSARTA